MREDILEHIFTQTKRGVLVTEQGLAGRFNEEWDGLKAAFDRSTGDSVTAGLQKNAPAAQEGRYYRFSLPARFVRMHLDFFKRFRYRLNPSYGGESLPVGGWAHFEGRYAFVCNENAACGAGEWYRCHESEVFGPSIQWQRLDGTPPGKGRDKYQHARLRLPGNRKPVEAVLQFSMLRGRPQIGDNASNPEPQAVHDWVESKRPEWLSWPPRRQPRFDLRLAEGNEIVVEPA